MINTRSGFFPCDAQYEHQTSGRHPMKPAVYIIVQVFANTCAGATASENKMIFFPTFYCCVQTRSFAEG